jgi:mannose-1-phosphate guanylyltransferase
MDYGVIIAGGSGTRLWPLSRRDQPKQLLPVIGGKSLLQLSYERLRGILPAERIYVCTNAAHAEGVLKNLPELPRENVLGEPEGRDTANAIGFSAAILKSRDPDAVMAVVTADHVIEPIELFQKSLRTAFEVVKQRPAALVTFGIVPTHGHTGLGYIHRGEALWLDGPAPASSTAQGASGAGESAGGTSAAYKVLAFREKPDKPTADRYVESGRYYWNSGMFVWRCDTVLNELAAHLPDSHAGLMKIAGAWNTPQRQAVLSDQYPKLPKISIDYAVMEPASQGKGKAEVVVVEMPVQWLDVGSWPSLAETLPMDANDNAEQCPAAMLIDSDDNIVISEVSGHLLALVGVSDMIVVHTPDATLVCPKSESERIKELVGRVKEKFGGKYQ